MTDFKIRKFEATHRFSASFAYDEEHQLFQVDRYEPFYLKDIKWCYLYSRRKGCYPNRAYSLEIYYEDKHGNLHSVWASDIPRHEDVCKFLKQLGIIITDSSYCNKSFYHKYKEDCIRVSFKEQGLDYDEEKAKYEQMQKEKLEWRHQHIWPFAKWCLIGFYSLFGFCFLAAIFGII